MREELKKEFDRLVKIHEDPRGCNKDLVKGKIEGIIFALKLVKENDFIDGVSESFSPKQSHKVRALLKDFYMWMQENDYDHNIPQRVENKAELFLREKNVR